MAWRWVVLIAIGVGLWTFVMWLPLNIVWTVLSERTDFSRSAYSIYGAGSGAAGAVYGVIVARSIGVHKRRTGGHRRRAAIMSDSYIEDIRRDHYRYRNELWGGLYCKTDNERWPCRMELCILEIERLTAEVARLTSERDEARAWSARWKAVAKRLWTGIHKSLDQSERLAARMLKALAEVAASAERERVLREAGEAMADSVMPLVRHLRRYSDHRGCDIADDAERAEKAWRAALATAGGESDQHGETWPCSVCGMPVTGAWCNGCEAPICERHGSHGGTHAPADHAAVVLGAGPSPAGGEQSA